MFDPGKGGRARKAPYTTIHYRIPEPIKPTVEKLASKFREVVYEMLGVESLLERVNEAIDTNSSDKNRELDELLLKLEEYQTEITQLKEEKAIAIRILQEGLAVKGNKAGEVKSFIKKAYSHLEKLE